MVVRPVLVGTGLDPLRHFVRVPVAVIAVNILNYRGA